MDLTRADVHAISVLGVQPGDTLLVHVSGALTLEQAERIKAVVAAQLSVPVPIIVAQDCCRFVVVRPVPLDSPAARA